jgi:hypothetical protein
MTRKPPDAAAVVATIPAEILARRDLSFAAKTLFGCVYSLAISHSKCFVSNGTLAERMGVEDRRYVQRLLRVLESKKLIEHCLNEEHHRDEITIIWQPGKVILGKRKAVNKPGGVKRPPRGGQLTVEGGSVDRNPDSLRDGLRQRQNPPQPPRAGGEGVDDLIDRAKKLRLAGASEAKVEDAVAVFKRAWIDRAMDVAEKNGAERWGYVVSLLRRWQDEGGPPPGRKREPKRPCDEPYEGPPLPAPDAIPPVEAGARIREIMAGADTSQAKSAT